MQYSININQEKLAKTDLDLVDAAILDYLHKYCNSLSDKIEQKRLTDEDGIKWTWINYDNLIDDMPLLRIKDKAPLSRRFKKLSEENYIITKKGQAGKFYVRLTAKVDGLYMDNNSDNPELLKSNTEVSELPKSNGSVAQKQRSIYDSNTKTLTSVYVGNARAGESGEKQEPWRTCPVKCNTHGLLDRYSGGHDECNQYIKSVEVLRKRGFVNFNKQMFALHDLLKAGYDFTDINRLIAKVEKNNKYAGNNWDFETLAKWADKEPMTSSQAVKKIPVFDNERGVVLID